MAQATRNLVDDAVAGRPVYISTVRERFEALPRSRTFLLTARLAGFEGDDRVFSFTLPRFAELGDDERRLTIEYVLAGLYNIISTLGGRGLSLETAGDQGEGEILAGVVAKEFGIGLTRLERPGYGRAVNVSERMDEAISAPGTTSSGTFQLVTGEAGAASGVRSTRGPAGEGMAKLCELSTSHLDGTAICGMDIGGTDIKLSLSIDGRIARLLEYDWFPAAFTTIDEIIDPVLVLTRLMRLEGACSRHVAGSTEIAAAVAPAYVPGASIGVMRAAAEAGERALAAPFALDAIGVCFPDVVVHDKIVGGEVYKTRGMRSALGAAYEEQFRRLSGLNEALGQFVLPGGVVGIINDGPMAAFTAAVELGAGDTAAIADGIFAHTLGTELGTGWVTQDGAIPDIPLEIYNCIIDLGSYPERRYPPDDVRSVLNFNTRLAGTLQKCTSQSGVFRLAAKYLPGEDPALFDELLTRGLLAWRGDSLVVPTDPQDMRKPLLEFLMKAAELGNPVIEKVFREVGEFLGIAWRESKWLLDPPSDERIVFGRLVKRRACFELMVEGGSSVAPGMELVVADDELANTDLMRQLRDSEGYTVAQFAQAIGAIHYANFRLKSLRGAPSVAGLA